MHPRRPSAAALALVAALALGACTDDGGERATPPPVTPAEAPVSTPSPTPPALPEEPPPTRGQIEAGCENGWVTPSEGSPRYLKPLDVIRRASGVRGPLIVVDMRYFEGPESPPSDKGYLLVVQRWYVKLYAENDLSFQGRFLVESRRFGRGLAAVAPYDTSGFGSPDWVGFQHDSSDPQERFYEGLPGRWPGIAYDFVEGGAGLSIPGLPEQVVGCLDGA